MNSSIILAFDVGGTQIKAAAVSGGTIIGSSVAHYESQSELAADEIIHNFARIVRDVIAKVEHDNQPISGLGMAFPGPFDYENGISLIRGLGKFDSLYGLPFGKLLEEALRSDATVQERLAPEFRITFENDASLFGLGEAVYGEAQGADRVVCLTIGTGLGSCFLEHGRLVKQRADVPENGWLYEVPYRNGIADDYISKRGIIQLALEVGLDLRGRDVRELANSAIAEDPGARQLFELFGQRMALILSPTLSVFVPDKIILGGQISKSGFLFAHTFQEGLALQGLRTQVLISQDTLTSTFMGIYDYVKRT
ncbi:ROK family protein [Paenibacillus aceris]|uniref:Glucokinase n=1 Tax=Paenibacillus aceris TaxID=869555 RepID=A0ABS4I3F8_9BACL|nr:glucokinase [Paenibacillus aceris]NHW36020.1 ROK family protein [Paenibacillus aceris]